jgi:hypothetical protein
MTYHHINALTEKTQCRAADALLSPIERQVVALSFGDPMSSVTAPARLSALLRSLLDIPRTNRLASARLEALRRYAVLRRLSGDIRDTEDEIAMYEAGFSGAQVAVVEALVRQHSKAAATRRYGRWSIWLFRALLFAKRLVSAGRG